MLLTQLLNPEELARLSTVQVNVLAGHVYTEIISNEQIRRILREKMAPVAARFVRAEGEGSTKSK